MRRTNLSELTIRVAATLGLCAALVWMASCNANGKPESDRQIQQQAQQATEKAEGAADKAAAEARVAAANAEREANDVAAGVKAGLHNGKGRRRGSEFREPGRSGNAAGCDGSDGTADREQSAV